MIMDIANPKPAEDGFIECPCRLPFMQASRSALIDALAAALGLMFHGSGCLDRLAYKRATIPVSGLERL
jgi:hypothetical protein